MKQRTTPSRMPTFETIEEAAAFWDEHDTTEFEDEWEPVELEVAQPLGHIISIRLASNDFRRLAAMARKRDTNIVALAETWVLEALERAEDAESDEVGAANRSSSSVTRS